MYEEISFVKISQKQHVFVRTKLIKTLKSNNPFHSLGLKVLVQERLSCYSIIREALKHKNNHTKLIATTYVFNLFTTIC